MKKQDFLETLYMHMIHTKARLQCYLKRLPFYHLC